jgi:hypothetical protein
MPLDDQMQKMILNYCDRDLPSDDDTEKLFDFIDEEKLRERVHLEYYAARYIYKLGEALAVKEERLHAHVKFQIVQYAGIYEALIVWMLWKKFPDHAAVAAIEFHSTYKHAANLPASVSLTSSSGEPITLCTERKEKTPRTSIKFDDKINAAVAIGFLHEPLGEEIKAFYKLRNAIHLESAVKNEINYEIENSQLAYKRIFPFTCGLKGFLKTNRLPQNAKIKASAAIVG